VPNPNNPQSLNRYTYCLNNPLKYIDPSGHYPWNYPPGADPYEWERSLIERGCDNGNGCGGNQRDNRPALPASNNPVEPTEPEPALPEDISENVCIGPPAPENYDEYKFNNDPLLAALSVTFVIVADDITGIGVVDDILIPVAWIGAGTAWIVINSEAIVDEISTRVDGIISWFAHRHRPGWEGAEHRGRESEATKGKHENPRPGRPAEKKKLKDDWQQR
jgi:hypothetical protein